MPFGKISAIAAATSVCCLTSPSALAAPATPQAAPAASIVAPAPHAAADFWNSMGVNVHMSYSNTPYKNVAEVLARLQQLDIRHVRDGLVPNRPDEISALQTLGNAGIEETLLVGTPGQDPGPLLDVVADHLSSDVEAIEGPNEYESSGAGWQTRLLPFQDLLYDDVTDSPALSSKLVIGPSVGGIEISSDDRANIHPYPGGGPPESNIAGQLAGAASTFGGAPVWATETGYQDAVNMTPAGSEQPATTDAAQSVYLPRTYASYFQHGIQRTFVYELLDEFRDPNAENPDARFGLLDNNMQPKPQFYAVARLANAVQDAPDPDPEPLDYAISDSGTNLQQLLLSRSDGSFQILLWRPVAVDSAGDAQGASAPLVLNLPFCADTTVLDPSTSPDTQDLGTGQRVSLPVGATLRVLHVIPTSCPGTSTPASPLATTVPASPPSTTAPSPRGTSTTTGIRTAPNPQIKKRKRKSSPRRVTRRRKPRSGKRLAALGHKPPHERIRAR